MPPIGLGKATTLVPVRAGRDRARERLAGEAVALPEREATVV